MRYSVVNGNGSKCDLCEKILYPYEVIHINARILTDHTGRNKVIGRCDMCKDCYDSLWQDIMREPRRIKKGGNKNDNWDERNN